MPQLTWLRPSSKLWEITRPRIELEVWYLPITVPEAMDVWPGWVGRLSTAAWSPWDWKKKNNDPSASVMLNISCQGFQKISIWLWVGEVPGKTYCQMDSGQIHTFGILDMKYWAPLMQKHEVFQKLSGFRRHFLKFEGRSQWIKRVC